MFGERPNQFARLIVGLAMTLVFVAVSRAQERFDTLRAGVITYSNVLILNKTPVDLFITHAQGLSNVKVKDLEAKVAGQLGYRELLSEVPEANSPPHIALPTLLTTPEVERLQAQLNESIQANITTLPPAFLMAYVTGVIVLYLFFCFCCKLICEKAEAPSRILIWLPGFQLFALYKAAKMPVWLPLGLLGPFWTGAALFFAPKPLDVHDPKTVILLAAGILCLIIPLILHAVWCFRIARAREKSGVVGLALLFPPTSFLAFIYLAFSGGNVQEKIVRVPRPNFVTFS